MPKFTCFAVVEVTAVTLVEADTAAEAIEIARDRPVVIGGNGSGADIDTEWVVEEADGEPNEIRVE